MSTPTVLRPLEKVTPNNHGPIVTVVTFTFLAFSVICVLTKAVSSVFYKHSVQVVDILIWIFLVIAFIQSILIQFAVDHGLGQHIEALSAADFDLYNKFVYSAQLLVILVLSLSKVSTAVLIRRISPNTNIRLFCLYTMIAVCAWTIFSLFGTAFQCKPPFWQYAPDRCSSEGAIMYPILVFNILTDLAIIMLSLFMIRNVQMPFVRRLQVFAAFATRGVLIGLTIAEFPFLTTYLHSNDSTWEFNIVAILNEITMHMSIVAACMPVLHRVLSSLGSGLNDVHIPEEVELSSGQRTNISVTKLRVSSKRRAGGGLLSQSILSSKNSTLGRSTHTSGVVVSHGRRNRSIDEESSESTRQLTTEEGLVRKTVDISVNVQDRDSDN